MNRNSVSNALTIHQDVEPQSASITDPRAWHRPIITIIDLKRTMLDGGYVDDGGTGSL